MTVVDTTTYDGEQTEPCETETSEETENEIPEAPEYLTQGAQIIAEHVAKLPATPGVYRMIGADDEVLYVGKAKALKKRVVSYTRPEKLSYRIAKMVSLTRDLVVVTTHTEAEALLLESNLIKKLKPRFNILLRDDKSFPYILMTADSEWPQLVKHRGTQSRPGEYYGPFASVHSVNRTMNTLQRAFPLRTCSDSVFASRTRPCLEYQIKRCSGPCVDRISREDYDTLVSEARHFLKGRSQEIQQRLAADMEAASEALEFEQAAALRDRIKALTAIQAKQDIHVPGLADADVIAGVQEGGQTCIQIFFYRNGQNFGNRSYFPRHAQNETVEEVISAFIGQFYAARTPPKTVMLSHAIPEQKLVAEALALRAEYKVELTVPQRGNKASLVARALDNASRELAEKMAETASQGKLLDGVAKLFALPARPDRIEVYDNSHVQGAHAIGGMIVSGPEGFMKNQYRRFNIAKESVVDGDDYAMMRQVMTRRFKRLVKEDPDRTKGQWPSLLLIDGGKGQLSAVTGVLEEMDLLDVPLVAISKGPDRNAGREQFHQNNRETFDLPPNDPVLYYLQRLRDEAHRYAIGSHRQKRSKAIGVSRLDDVPNIGPKRKKALLHAFGSVDAISRAGVSDLQNVEGVSKAVAQVIYDYFHGTD